MPAIGLPKLCLFCLHLSTYKICYNTIELIGLDEERELSNFWQNLLLNVWSRHQEIAGQWTLCKLCRKSNMYSDAVQILSLLNANKAMIALGKRR